MVQSLTGMQFETRFDLLRMKNPSNVMIVVNSSDRFQGQEADVVFISLRNGSRIGFFDSPSRMNVAITRPRELRIIVGNHEYFSGKMERPYCYERNLAKSHIAVDRTPKEEMKMDVQLRTKGQVEVYDIITTFAVSAPAVGLQKFCQYAQQNGDHIDDKSIEQQFKLKPGHLEIFS